jgi:hypothetical protein
MWYMTCVLKFHGIDAWRVTVCCPLSKSMQAQDTRLISCLPINEEGQAVIKELRRLAAGPKAISDGGSDADADSTPKLLASAPAAAAAAEAARDSSKQRHKEAGQAADATVVRTGRVSGGQGDPRQQQLEGGGSGQDSASRVREEPEDDAKAVHDEL